MMVMCISMLARFSLRPVWCGYARHVSCKAYDLVAGKHAMEPSYWISRREALEKFPMLRKKGLKGGVVYYDGQQNDSRMALAIAQTALVHGAAVANHVEVMRLLKDSSTGRVVGAHVRDRLTGSEWDVRARNVVNATGIVCGCVRLSIWVVVGRGGGGSDYSRLLVRTVSFNNGDGWVCIMGGGRDLVTSVLMCAGPFSDAIRHMDDPALKNIIAPSSGVHIVLSDKYSPTGMGLIRPSSDGRVLFLLPWEGGTIAGTTDSTSELSELPRPHEAEIEFILNEIRTFLDVNVKREDVDAAWSGIRPLARDPNAKNTGLHVHHMLVVVVVVPWL